MRWNGRVSRRLSASVAVASAAVVTLAVGPTPAAADHSWGGYHWARGASQFSPALELGTNFATNPTTWGQLLERDVSPDWSRTDSGNPVRTRVVAGSTDGRKCRARSGRVEVCSQKYGFNGWLGLASVWASGAHITQATVKLNDSYFNTRTYDTPEWRQSVMCQEVGHTLGLDHQSEDPEVNRATCMDYYKVPNLRPNGHDYEWLSSIYGHDDSTTTIGADSSRTRGKGRGLRRVHNSLWVEDLGNGNKRLVWVLWERRGSRYASPAEG
jgi:hypothetical protein